VKPSHETDAEWMAFHVFYAANSNPMLVEGIGPVIARLREQGLIARWFFIRYWMEGPHVRLRVLPASGSVAAEVRAQVEAALREFLRRRPALYEADRDISGDMYKRMYLAEYSQEQWDAEYGADGVMPYRDNNAFYDFAYEPEYDRYGGPAGLALSEWHFEKSSDIVLRLIETTNVHVRTVLLGQTAQLDMALCYAFLRDERAIGVFLENYRAFWENQFDALAKFLESTKEEKRTCQQRKANPASPFRSAAPSRRRATKSSPPGRNANN